MGRPTNSLFLCRTRVQIKSLYLCARLCTTTWIFFYVVNGGNPNTYTGKSKIAMATQRVKISTPPCGRSLTEGHVLGRIFLAANANEWGDSSMQEQYSSTAQQTIHAWHLSGTSTRPSKWCTQNTVGGGGGGVLTFLGFCFFNPPTDG